MLIPFTQGTGLFSGWDSIAIHNTSHAFHVSLPSGTVTNLGAMADLTTAATGGEPPTVCESGYYYGVAELFGNALFIDWVGGDKINRTRVPDGLTTTIQSFNAGGLGEMCGFAFLPSQTAKWVWQLENDSQFGTAVGENTLGVCEATFDHP